MTRITALVVAYESSEFIAGCVESALASGVDRVVIWDNSPSDSTRLTVEAMANPDVEFHSDGSNHGFGGGMNRAFQFCNPDDHILLLNPDCVCVPEVVSALSQAIEDPRVGIAAPRMRYPDGRYGVAGGPSPTILKEFAAKTRIDELLPSAWREKILSSFPSRAGSGSYGQTLQAGDPIVVDWVSGFCCMIRAEVYRRVAGFDEDYFLYFEDVDLCKRIKDIGLDVLLVRSAEALHFESTSTSSRGKSSHYYRGLTTYFSKHGSPFQRLSSRFMEVKS